MLLKCIKNLNKKFNERFGRRTRLIVFDFSENQLVFSIPVRKFNQSRQEPSHQRLGKGGTNVPPPPISKYFSEIFSPSHIKLTNKTRIWTLNRSSDRRNWRILNKIVKYFRIGK